MVHALVHNPLKANSSLWRHRKALPAGLELRPCGQRAGARSRRHESSSAFEAVGAASRTASILIKNALSVCTADVFPHQRKLKAEPVLVDRKRGAEALQIVCAQTWEH